MIKTVQRKFVAIAMGSLIFILILIISIINIANFYNTNERVNSILSIIADNKGTFPELSKNDSDSFNDLSHKYQQTPESSFETRYFVAKVSADDEVTEIDLSQIAALDETEAAEYIESILERQATTGYLGYYKYLKTDTEDGRLIIVVDCRLYIQSIFSLLLISCLVTIPSLLLMFILTSVLSRHILSPVAQSIEKQKQFVTDAGHEIKTPLAIISANTDVIELTQGGSQWLSSIRGQTKRLDELVKNLLQLASLDEKEASGQTQNKFCISETIQASAKAFTALAKARKLTLKYDIQPKLIFCGNESEISQLIGILLDNAIKYAAEDGSVEVKLQLSGKNIQLEVSNTAPEQLDCNLDRLFDRFYRGDESRARASGGYGIGLSIAKGIVDSYKGSIRAFYKEQDICFQVGLHK